MMELHKDLLALPNIIVLGSTAFGVSTPESDLDIAILRKDLPSYYRGVKELSIDNYFSILPMGNVSLIRQPGLDILIYDKQEDLDTLKKVIKELLLVPKYLLKIKNIRITLFEEALIHYGFKRTEHEVTTTPDNTFEMPF